MTQAEIAPRLFEQDYLSLKKCKHGTFLYNVNDTFIGRSLDIYGEWCEQEMHILGQVLQPGQVVLDIGANIGTHTVFFAKHVGQQGAVFAFEPQRVIYQMLCANLALNNLLNVLTKQAGVGDVKTTMKMPVFNPQAKINFGAVPLVGQTVGEPVDVTRIDDLEMRRCHLIKIDVEGMEAKVLLGAKETIKRFRPLLFVENDTLERSREIITLLKSLGYICFWQIAAYYNPKNFFQNEENIFKNYQPSANLLCFPEKATLNIQGLEPVLGEDDNWQSAVKRIFEKRASTSESNT
jgi:FkbM family methyltransferase